MRPVIGITCDEGQTEARRNPLRPSVTRLELKRFYASAVWSAGGLPLLVPTTGEPGAEPDAAEVVAALDGLVVSGGGADIPPDLYGAEPEPEVVAPKRGRSTFEIAAVRCALERGVPVLGICGGLQVLNVACGGTLVQHIPRRFPEAIPHQQPGDPREPSHAVTIDAASRLASVCGAEALPVNSTHHQAVDRPGDGLRVVAHAFDGVVEAVEGLRGTFALGVQWHPESLAHLPRHLAIYRAVVDAARARSGRTR